jgi:hypothetical protein
MLFFLWPLIRLVSRSGQHVNGWMDRKHGRTGGRRRELLLFSISLSQYAVLRPPTYSLLFVDLILRRCDSIYASRNSDREDIDGINTRL